MSRKGENIYKRKDGRWEGRFIVSHGLDAKAKYCYVYDKSYSGIRKKLRERQANQSNLQQATKASDYNHILDCWIADICGSVKDSAYSRYCYIVNKHIRPRLGRVEMRNFTVDIIDEFTRVLQTSDRLDGKGGLSAKTVSDIRSIMQNTFSYAKRKGYSVPENKSNNYRA